MKDAGDHHTCHAVACVDYYLERLYLAHIDERKRMLDVVVEYVTLDDVSFMLGFGEIALYRQIADIGQAGYQADRSCLRTAQFHAVVCGGIMGCGDHYTGRVIEFTYREI